MNRAGSMGGEGLLLLFWCFYCKRLQFWRYCLKAQVRGYFLMKNILLVEQISHMAVCQD